MNLNIKNQLFVICGATSGFGRATLNKLLENGARVIAIARGREKLDHLAKKFHGQVESLCGDITHPNTLLQLLEKINYRPISGVLINAGGPPALKFMETQIEDWDNSYRQLLRWKIELTRALIPLMQRENYGRLLFIESASVKQPMENLILSTSLRLAVVGFVKTLSQEIADTGITLNVLAPGFHDTPAINRLLEKKSREESITREEAKNQILQSLKTKKMGNPEHLGSLACWLLSPYSQYITGQTISIDGGEIAGIMG